MSLDVKLNLSEHLKYITYKVNESIRLLRKSQKILQRPSLVTINKSYIRRHHDYRALSLIKRSTSHNMKT